MVARAIASRSGRGRGARGRSRRCPRSRWLGQSDRGGGRDARGARARRGSRAGTRTRPGRAEGAAMEGVSAAVADMSRVLGRACRARVRPKPRLDRRKTPLRTRSPRGCASIRRTGPLEPTTRSWARRQPILWRPGSIVVRATCTDVQSRSFARGARFRLATSRACGLATPRAFSRSFESAFFPLLARDVGSRSGGL